MSQLPNSVIGPKEHVAVLSSELSQFRLRRTQRYAAINVLLLTWKDTDLEIADEVNQLKQVFRECFAYFVWHYHIPSENSQTQLVLRVAQFIDSFGRNDDNLILVYYGGHGGPAKGTECIWSAKIIGGPTLDWSIVQPLFLNANCDVVIFLDCCYAGQAIRSRSAHNIEFLAATDKDQFTPTGNYPGRPSFTKVLSNQLVKILEKDDAVTIPGLHNRMLRADLGLIKQPFYAVLSEDHSAGRIRLTRWKNLTLPLQCTVTPSHRPTAEHAASLFLRLSLFGPLDASGRQSLTRWMTRDSPSSIQDIQVIEEAVSQAEAVKSLGQAVMSPHEDISSGTLPLLSSQGRQEAMKLLDALKDALYMPESSQFSEIDTTEIINDINQKSEELITFLTDSLSSLEPQSLKSFGVGDAYGIKDLASRIAMRLSLLQEEVRQDMTGVDFNDRAQAGQHLRFGKQAGAPVLVEYWHYEFVSQQDFTRIGSQVAKIAALLGESKTEAFRILPGKGYLHETLHGRRFGLIYQLPHDTGDQSVIILSKFMEEVKIVPLELRYRLASCLCEAIQHLHSIGWFHKGIKSDNIILLSRENPPHADGISHEAYDVKRPYLIGFDCSRPSDAETWSTANFNAENNIYMHPDRWGKPLRYERHHDIYALGTLLLEIGLWRRLSTLDSKKKNFSWIAPQRLLDFYLKTACPKLAHAAGSKFASAVETCLHPRNWRDYEDWQFQRVIRQQVWQPLCEGP